MKRSDVIYTLKVVAVLGGAGAVLACVHSFLPGTPWWLRWALLAAVASGAIVTIGSFRSSGERDGAAAPLGAGRAHFGGEPVARGIYWCPRDGRFVQADPGRPLPGKATRVYYRLSAIEFVLLFPIAGLAYRVLFPLLALGTIAWVGAAAIVRRAFQTLHRAGT